ncbi:MAG TPA: histidine kinase dimerization/phosphoacceptor domain -containing protein, partial [Methanocella sp.]|nr:histidine kinase dimerization/phosphoacceptor domain -containing protein [Methanocella sp.]
GADAVLAKWPDLVECCIEKKETQMEILLNDLRNGRWLETRISLLYTSERQPPGLLIILHDITELKRNEETLKRFNESLQAEIKEREKAEETIKASLHEKEVLLKEIHHRVKNNLQIISSLLSLQSGTGQGGPEAFRESQNRIKSMALIHEKLYRSENLSHVDFSEYVASLTGYLTKSYILRPNVALQIDIQDISLDVDTAIPCGLIINELVSNTLKYAFRDGMAGTIRVSMDRDKGGYVLKVGDNGSGLPKGLDFRNSPSLGLQLVNTLVDQIGGTIELEPGSGTTFVITFAGPRTGEKTSFAKPPPGEARER